MLIMVMQARIVAKRSLLRQQGIMAAALQLLSPLSGPVTNLDQITKLLR